MTALYQCRTSGLAKWFITKFDRDANVEASYQVDWDTCECPRGAHPDCRHRKMLKTFIKSGHVNDGWFLDYETRLWTKPLANILTEDLMAAGVVEPINLPDLPAGVEAFGFVGEASPSPSPATEGNGATIPSAPEESSLRTPSGATHLNQFCFIRRTGDAN